MRIIELKRSQSVYEISKSYDELVSIQEPATLRLPVNITDSRICSRGDLMQFIFTWAYLYPEAAISTYLDDGQTESGLKKLFSEEYGFAAALCAQMHGLIPSRQFLMKDGTPIQTDIIKAEFKEAISRTNLTIKKGQRSATIINDWIERKYPENAYCDIYNKKKHQKTSGARMEFEKSLRELPRIKNRPMLEADSVDSPYLMLGNAFYELIENADRWGRADLDRISIKGYFMHLHTRESLTQTPVSEEQQETPALKAYLTSLKGSNNELVEDYLEISIFDNGPGLSGRYSNKKRSTLKEQHTNVVDCFTRWAGSSQKENEGQGLYKTLVILNKLKGFLRYRSENLNLYRDLKNNPLSEASIKLLETAHSQGQPKEDLAQVLDLRDFTKSNKRLKKHPFAVGALFTVIVPIVDLKNDE